jgi:ketosteroid isomerase-like protein
MSQENVELTHRAHDAFNRRDLDAFLALMDPHTEFTPYEVWVQGGKPYRGHDGMRRWWEESFEVLPDLRVELHEVRDLGDVIFVRGRLYGHGAGSGAPFERTLCETLEWRDMKQVWGCAFASEAEALEAVGLRG